MNKRQAIAVIRETNINPVLEHDDERGAPERGLVAPVLLPSVGPVAVELDLGDALMAGLSMQTLARNGRISDPVTAALYAKVGKQLTDAARVAAKDIGVSR